MNNIADLVRLEMTKKSLHNVGAALTMWRADWGRYPETLAELPPNYLRTVPPGPTGRPEDWKYVPSDDGKSYALSVDGFASLGLSSGLPRLDACKEVETERNLQVVLADYRYELPSDESAWVRTGRTGFSRQQTMDFRLAGPTQFGQTGQSWVEQTAAGLTARKDVEVEVQRPFQHEELSGVEIICKSSRARQHIFYLTDGTLAWEYFYVAAFADFNEADDALFVSLLKNRKKTQSQ